MDDEIQAKFRQVRDVYDERFRSEAASQKNDDYIQHLHDKLELWRADTKEFLKTIVEDERYEIDRAYKRFQQEAKEKYEDLKEQMKSNPSASAVSDLIDEFNSFCQTSKLDKQLQLRIYDFQKHELTDKVGLEYKPYEDIAPEQPIDPLKPIDSSARKPSPSTSKPKPIILKPDTEPVKEIPTPYSPRIASYTKPRTESTDEELTDPSQKRLPPPTDNPVKSSTQLYVGEDTVFTPVLIGKNREHPKGSPSLVEYVIDSVLLQSYEQHQPSHVNNENDDSLVRTYKKLIQDENTGQKRLESPSDRQNGPQSTPTNGFDLQKLNQIDYSTIMLQKCETQYNCIASSTKRNELIIYNSKLKVLIVLQHADHQACRERYYLQWPEEFHPDISDITYCAGDDKYLICTRNPSRIYSFDRELLSVSDLGGLSKDLHLRRIHCHERSVYCILSDNYLLEYQFDEQYSKLTLVQNRIMLFNPENRSQGTPYQLLDVACATDLLAVVYVGDHSDIRLQTIHRETRAFHSDLVLDATKHINRSYIRIEPITHQNSLIYVNGLQKCLKTVDFDNHPTGKVTSSLNRWTTPTNSCLLSDGRFVILHEDPYYLSVHETPDRPKANQS